MKITGINNLDDRISDGDKNYPKEQIVVTFGRSNIFFDNFREIVHYRNGKTKKYAGFRNDNKKTITL